MSEIHRPAPEGADKDPMQIALDKFDRQTSSPKYDARALKRALNSVRNTGARLGASPGELYANLAALSGIAADLAGARGREEDQKVFTQQKQQYEAATELSQEGPQEPASQLILPSNPRRKTGRASG